MGRAIVFCGLPCHLIMLCEYHKHSVGKGRPL
jgi:hypothetical protein